MKDIITVDDELLSHREAATKIVTIRDRVVLFVVIEAKDWSLLRKKTNALYEDLKLILRVFEEFGDAGSASG